MINKNDIERLFKANYEQMYRLALMLLGDSETARDVVHDIFETLLRAKNETVPSAAYLLKAVRNNCLNRIRNNSVRERVAGLYFLDLEQYDETSWPDEQTVTRIYEIIKHDLTPQSRNVMELRFCQGMTFAMVAKEMGISETAVYKHFRQAIFIIRKNLSENG